MKEKYTASVQCSQWRKEKERSARKSKKEQEKARKKDRGGVESKPKEEK